MVVRRAMLLGLLIVMIAGCAGAPASGRRPRSESGSSRVAGASASAQVSTAQSPPKVASDDAHGPGASASAPSVVAAAAGGNAMRAAPDEGLDPKISFAWPQTAPRADARCEPGLYTGTYHCEAFDTVPFDGEVNFRFERSADGEFLELADGKLDGQWNDTYDFSSGLKGRLDCSTLSFSADVVDGGWAPIGAFQGVLASGMFTGMLTGTLDPNTMQISGEWQMLSDVIVDCKGPWSVGLKK